MVKTHMRWFPQLMASVALWIAGIGVASAQLGNVSLLFVCTPQTEFVSGDSNTAYGSLALYNNAGSQLSNNSAFGAGALYNDGYAVMQPGSNNTAVGVHALYANTSGNCNSALGLNALANNIGSNNTASGASAMQGNYSYRAGPTSGNNNTATGVSALRYDLTGSYNSAYGAAALASNSGGSFNTAIGVSAMYGYQGASAFEQSGGELGSYNTAIGFQALFNYSGAADNTAVGTSALYTNINGNLNTAVGYGTLFHSTGDYNVAIGYEAGYTLTRGSNNIYIVHPGEPVESGITRIGTPGTQTAVYIAGIENAKITGSAVYVTSSGQLGVLASSERYKTDITPIGTGTEKLQQLRPVSFHLKTDPKGAVQYGLIAEEVDKVYPELVIRDDKGKIQGVRYDELGPMLLNEMQKQRQKLAAQDQRAASQDEKISQLQEQLTEMHAALLKLESKDQLVAQR
jgi:hypothetical protein